MFKNNLKIAWRNLVKDRQFTFLNLLGLSTGLVCTLLIYLWVNDELHVDKYNEKDGQLYQLFKNVPNSDGTIFTSENTQGLLAKSMAADLPEIAYAVSVKKEGQLGVLSSGDKHIKAKSAFVDSNFFNVFSYHLIEGDKKNMVPDNSGVLLSDKLALKLFNSTHNIIGKTILWDRGTKFGGLYKVSGVFESLPSSATDQYDIIFAYNLFIEKETGGMGDVSFWGSNMAHTYLVLKNGTNIDQFNKKIKDYTKDKIRSLYANNDMIKYEGDLFAMRFSDVYLHNHFDNGVLSGGRIVYVRLFSIIAIFILVIACINFMNLSTAKASRRLKEIGIKKVVGATRTSLVFQYMTESLVMSFLSLVIAAGAIVLLLPAFNQIAGKQIVFNFSSNIILSVIGITFITGLIAGSYPALYLSRFNAVSVLKGKLKTSVSELLVRKGLVVFQFTLSAVFIVAVLVVYKQMNLVQTINLGYNKDNIIEFASEGNLRKNPDAFFDEVKKIPGVIDAASMEGDFLGNPGHSGGGISWEGKDPRLGIEYYGIGVSYNCMEMFGLTMQEGRSFSAAYGADSTKVIFNESAIKAMGLKDPIGKTVSLWGKKNQIIGVVKDFHFQSLYNKVGPFFLYYSPAAENNDIVVKIRAGMEKQSLADLENIYKQYNQGLPFEYKFLDESYQKLYASEQRVASLSGYAAVLAIIISCLGLFGLAAFTAQKRQKEIGIRKVVGATAASVALLLSKDFLMLVLIAVLIAFPLSWWAMNEWLHSFAYRINIGAGTYIIAALSIIVISVITVSFQSIKAAVMNPVKSLRSE